MITAIAVPGLPCTASGPVPGFSATTDEKVKEQEKAARVKYFSELRAVRKENAERHSMRCDTDLKFSVAKEFEGKTFYFPFNIDFRGRAYPIPPHLNHMGSDFTRGLLKVGSWHSAAWLSSSAHSPFWSAACCSSRKAASWARTVCAG